MAQGLPLQRRLAALQAPLRASAKDARSFGSEIDAAVMALLERIAFAAIGERRGVLREGALERVGARLRRQPSAAVAGEALADEASWVAPLLESSGGDRISFDAASLDRAAEMLAAARETECAEALAARLHERLVAGASASGGTGPRRKVGGVFYTPGFVAEYIVGAALGRIAPPAIGGRLPQVLDPACGSGVFLVEALCQLRRSGPGAISPQAALEAVHGVDLDARAVEVARCAVMMEHVAGLESPGRDVGGLDAAAETLRANVRCGNALIASAEIARGPFDYGRCAASAQGDPSTTASQRESSAQGERDATAGQGDPSTTASLRESSAQGERDATAAQGDPSTAASLREASAQGERFDWGSSFPEVCGPGATGFDAIVGNPPYRRELNHKALLDAIAATAFGARHRAPRMDLWFYFVHRALELLAPGGVLAFIVNGYWLASRGAHKLVAALRDEAQVEEIFCLDRLRVFDGISGDHVILTARKGRALPPAMTLIKRPAPGCGATGTSAEPLVRGHAPLLAFERAATDLFRGGRVDVGPPHSSPELLDRLERWPALGSLGRVRQGIAENPSTITGRLNARFGDRFRVGEGVFVLTPEEVERLGIADDGPERALLRPYHVLRDLGRYHCAERASRLLLYSTPATWPELDRFPALRRHLERFRPILEARRETRLGRVPWWQLHWPREDALWSTPKLVALQMAPRPAFAAAPAQVCVPFSANVFVPAPERRESLEYFAAILNSQLLGHWFARHAKRRGVGLEINVGVLARAPIRTLDLDSSADRAARDAICEASRRLHQLRDTLALDAAAGRPAGHPARKAAEREVHDLDLALERLVFNLYEIEGELDFPEFAV